MSAIASLSIASAPAAPAAPAAPERIVIPDTSATPNIAPGNAPAPTIVSEKTTVLPPSTPEPPPERPAWLPEGFDKPEDLAKAYTEAKANSTVDFDAISKEYEETGNVSDETLAKYEKVLPKSFVQNYIAGLNAQAQVVTQQVHSAVGGPEQFDAIRSWAKSSLTAEETAQFDATIKTGDVGKIVAAAKGLKAQYEARFGAAPAAPVRGAATPAAEVAFTSQHELIAAYQNPRYQTDPAYRESVNRRAMISRV